MSAWVEYRLPPDCSQVDSGAWTTDQAPKYGKLYKEPLQGKLSNGDCPDKTFTFAAIYYEWTAHHNKSKTDVFNATWKSQSFTKPFVFNNEVPIVRPAGEKTKFTGWADTRGLWMQELIPPDNDKNFDFSGEVVREVNVGARDTCYDGKFPLGQATLTEHRWRVFNKVFWGPDGVGWGTNDAAAGQCAIHYYRCMKKGACGFVLHQQMEISSPADKGAFVPYGEVNTLTSFIAGSVNPLFGGLGPISSRRANGAFQSKFFPTRSSSCPKVVRDMLPFGC